jgi:hypothetical protein
MPLRAGRNTRMAHRRAARRAVAIDGAQLMFALGFIALGSVGFE